jgi:hypothetical protein
MIYAVGDSHSYICSGQPGFVWMYHELVPNKLKGPTAHNLVNPHSASGMRGRILELAESLDPEQDQFILSFGEIDCRVHIYRQHMKTGKDIVELIGETIERYLRFVAELEEKGFRVWVLGVPPCGTQGNKYDFDYYPSPEQQREIFRLFNDRMREVCPGYIDVYSRTVNEEGIMKKEYVRDDIHLNKKAFPIVLEKLKEDDDG